MAYPRALLAPDEEVVIDRHPHWKALLGPVLVLVLAIAAAVVAWVWLDSASMGDGARATIGWVVAGVLAIVMVWLSIAPFVRWSTTHFVVTDRRVIFRTGVFTKNGIDIPLARINTVQFRHGLIDRMFRTGTLIIESASDDPLSFDDIPDVERVHARLYEEIIDTLDGDDDRRPPTGLAPGGPSAS